MVAGSWKEGKVYVWNLEQPEHPIQLTGHTDSIEVVAFSPNGRMLASGAWDNTTRLWDVTLGKEIATLPVDMPLTTRAIKFSPCGNMIAGGLGSEIRLWCTEQHTTLRTIPQPDNN